MKVWGLLPTPCVGTHGRGGIPHKGVVNALLNGEKPKIQELLVDRVFAEELKKKGVNHVETFRNFQIPKEKLLSTPTAIQREHPADVALGLDNPDKSNGNMQLNPQFVLEMMGFPTDFTQKPFNNVVV
jgi:hypothetical protein